MNEETKKDDFITMRIFAREVLAKRPDLDENQCMEVLKTIGGNYENGMVYDLKSELEPAWGRAIEAWANELFPRQEQRQNQELELER